MIVYKFGGASVRDAAGIRILCDLVRKEKEKLVGVFRLFSENSVKINMVRTGAVSINVCADNEEPKMGRVLDKLRRQHGTI